MNYTLIFRKFTRSNAAGCTCLYYLYLHINIYCNGKCWVLHFPTKPATPVFEKGDSNFERQKKEKRKHFTLTYKTKNASLRNLYSENTLSRNSRTPGQLAPEFR